MAAHSTKKTPRGGSRRQQKPRPELKGPEEPPGVPVDTKDQGKRVFWIQGASVTLTLLLVIALFFLAVFRVPVPTGVAVLSIAVVGLWSRFFPWKAFSPFQENLQKEIDKHLKKPKTARVLVVLAPIVVAVAIGDWILNTNCPVLRIKPGGSLAYLLGGPKDKPHKPPDRTYEIVVSRKPKDGMRKEIDIGRYSPRYAGTLDVGAPEGYLRWRVANQEGYANVLDLVKLEEYIPWQKARDDNEGGEKDKRWFLGTERLEQGETIIISFRCKATNAQLFEDTEKTIASGLLTKVSIDPDLDGNDKNYYDRVANCEPL